MSPFKPCLVFTSLTGGEAGGRWSFQGGCGEGQSQSVHVVDGSVPECVLRRQSRCVCVGASVHKCVCGDEGHSLSVCDLRGLSRSVCGGGQTRSVCFVGWGQSQSGMEDEHSRNGGGGVKNALSVLNKI